MAVEDNFPVPPGDPMIVLAAVNALQRTVGKLDRSSRSLSAEHAGMAARWIGPAGAAAADEIRQAGKITADYTRRIRDCAAALNEYGTALDEAIKRVNGIRAQVRQAVADAVQRANRSGPMSADHWRAVVDGAVGPTLRGLALQYHYEDQALRAAAEKAAGALTGLVPSYVPGMKPELLTEKARREVASGLPMLQRADGERVGNASAE